MAPLVEDLRFRGLVHQMTDPALGDHLDRGSLTAYSGFDPTADSLHVGHLLQLCNLRRLQLAGHRPIAVAGGATGLIGDPGGKSEERTLLSPEELRANTEGVHAQLRQFLEGGGAEGVPGAVLVDNSEWLGSLSLLEFLREVGKHFTVGQMTAKDSVRSRLARPEQGISYTEFSYMLLQAYDFLHLYDSFDCRLQLGGSDQWGNITMGIDLIRKMRRAEAWGLTTPLVVKADGTKFGKTESGTVWLDPARTSPYQLYQFFLRTEDEVVGSYLRYFTFLPHEAITELDRATADRPERRQAQRELARQVCTLVHGPGETGRAEEAAAALFGEGVNLLDERSLLDVFAEAPSTGLARGRLDDGGGLPLVDLLTETGVLPSKSRARSTVEQGGIYVNNRRERDVERSIRRGGSHRWPLPRPAAAASATTTLCASPECAALRPGRRPTSRHRPTLSAMTGTGATEGGTSSVRVTTGLPETVLAPDPEEVGERLATAAALSGEERRDAVSEVVGDHPASSTAWAALGSLARDEVEAYACFRVGYHRGLDALRRAGWKGSGLVRFEHPSNRGFLRCVDGLRATAGAIGEVDEEARCAQFLRQLDPTWDPGPTASAG